MLQRETPQCYDVAPLGLKAASADGVRAVGLVLVELQSVRWQLQEQQVASQEQVLDHIASQRCKVFSN